MYVNKNF